MARIHANKVTPKSNKETNKWNCLMLLSLCFCKKNDNSLKCNESDFNVNVNKEVEFKDLSALIEDKPLDIEQVQRQILEMDYELAERRIRTNLCLEPKVHEFDNEEIKSFTETNGLDPHSPISIYEIAISARLEGRVKFIECIVD